MDFLKKKKQTQEPKERNEITNKELKEHFATIALSLLQKDIDYKRLEYTAVEYGYLFVIEDHGIEALFKIITDKTIVYFAVQQKKLMRLAFTEELFQTTVNGFLERHH